MESGTRELEGTWEEILAHSGELAGCRVSLKVYPPTSTPSEELHIRPENQAALEVLKELKDHPVSEEETKVLEEFEQFRKDHPIRFRLPEDQP